MGEQLPNFEKKLNSFLPCENKKPPKYIFCIFGGMLTEPKISHRAFPVCACGCFVVI
jgi:hypothetical protein